MGLREKVDFSQGAAGFRMEFTHWSRKGKCAEKGRWLPEATDVLEGNSLEGYLKIAMDALEKNVRGLQE